MVVTRIAFRTAVRAAAVTMLQNYKDTVDNRMQIYRGRPRSIMPPTAFVDSIREDYDYSNVTWRQRKCVAEVVVLFGVFDSGDAVDQADKTADAFLDWVTDNFHAAGANTTVGIVAIEDEATYVPDWLPPAEQKTYFATRYTLEGRAGG
jgi:hypothetical protein